MKALVLHGIRDLRVEDWPEPEPGPGQVKVGVRAVGICGSDVHYYKHGRIGNQVVERPQIVGHEGAGEVLEVGPGVEGLEVGRRVAVEPSRYCGECEWCLADKPNVCPAVEFRSTPPCDGLVCEAVILQPQQCVPIPDSMTFEEAAMLEPLQVTVHAANVIGPGPGETVTVVGAGTIGLGCLAMARLAGAKRIIVTDRLDYRLAFAKARGADDVVNAETTDPVEAVMALTDGRGTDVVFECTNSAAGAPQAYDVAAVCGRVGMVGIPEEDQIVLDAHDYRRKELCVRYVRRSRHAAERAISLVASGDVDVASWITHRVGLEEAPKTFEMVADYADGVLKAMVVPGE